MSQSETIPADAHEHLLAELRRIDRLLKAYLAEWQSESVGDGAPGPYVSAEEVVALLDASHDRDGDGRSAGNDRPAGNDGLDEIRERGHELDEAASRGLAEGRDLRLAKLAERFDLSRRERDALLLAVAPAVDEKYEKVYAYLRDAVPPSRPTVGLILRVLSSSTTDRLGATSLFARSGTLVGGHLVDLSGGNEVPHLSQAVAPDRRTASYLLGEDDPDPAIADDVSLVSPDRVVEDLPVEDDSRAALADLDSGGEPGLYYFYGPDGAGKRRAVEAVCRDRPVLRVDAELLAADDRFRDRVVREARLRAVPVHVEDVDQVGDEGRISLHEEGDSGVPDRERRGRAVTDLVAGLDGFDGDVFLTGEERWLPTRDLDRAFSIVEFPRPGHGLRRELWRERADVLPDDVDPDDLATTFELTQGEIDDAVRTACALDPGGELTRETLYEGCKAQSCGRLSDLAEKVDPGYAWDDIVLPEDTETHLREVAAHVNHRGTVYADWGFEEKFSRGTGVVALFSGPSGTGKTMAAEVLANDASLDLYKVDLSSVVSKYVGETEENLERIFDEAEHSSAILLFDEADAVFGERSEVSDSNDRYANVEVNYLLQRIESHDGVVLMTTNYEQNIDDAFLRRIHLSVDFRTPDRTARRRIWEGIFPDAMPTGDLDYDFLAGLELTGGNIRNIAQTAAFLAADEAGVVEMAHVVRAARREYQKTGKLVDPSEFEEYRELLTG